MKQSITTDRAPSAIGPYSQSIKANNMLYISGQIPIDNTNGSIPDDISEQTTQSLKNGEEILKAAGLSMSNVVKTTVFMTDLADFTAMNEVYASFFSEPYPARSTIEVAGLPRGAKVEIEMIAVF
ncbi:MAG: RidA family protein [Oscillospiraceae bacterium]|nr:RidA family protein [Oscillospiraceae bacterium]